MELLLVIFLKKNLGVDFIIVNIWGTTILFFIPTQQGIKENKLWNLPGWKTVDLMNEWLNQLVETEEDIHVFLPSGTAPSGSFWFILVILFPFVSKWDRDPSSSFDFFLIYLFFYVVPCPSWRIRESSHWFGVDCI